LSKRLEELQINNVGILRELCTDSLHQRYKHIVLIYDGFVFHKDDRLLEGFKHLQELFVALFSEVDYLEGLCQFFEFLVLLQIKAVHYEDDVDVSQVHK